MNIWNLTKNTMLKSETFSNFSDKTDICQNDNCFLVYTLHKSTVCIHHLLNGEFQLSDWHYR